MIKYLGSKRTLIPFICEVAEILRPTTALDMFTGTTRVAQALKGLGIHTTANDLASYSKALADCYIATDAETIDRKELAQVIDDLMTTPGKAGYFTETFCEKARFFQPKNGARVDAIRERIEKEFKESPLYPILLVSLMEAADRVDSTTGVQMAYLKQWAPRSYNDLQMRLPELLPGTGISYQSDANALALKLPRFDLIYLDPPYNQHRYFTNYHIWETLMRWDKPESYGVAQKRIDARDSSTKSAYNRKNEMPLAFAELIRTLQAEAMMISYNNESWLSAAEISGFLAENYEAVQVFEFDYKRYVGAQIGIHNPSGEKVGKVSHVRNKELIFIASADSIISQLNGTLK